MPKFDIECAVVTRTGIGFATIRVEAQSQQEAELKALDEAGNHLFSEKASEYELTHGPSHRPDRKTDALKGGDLDKAIPGLAGAVSGNQLDALTAQAEHLAERQERQERHQHPLARAIVANLWRRYRLERERLSRFQADSQTKSLPEAWLMTMDASKTEAWNAAVVSSSMLYAVGDHADLHRELGIDALQVQAAGACLPQTASQETEPQDLLRLRGG